MEKVKTKVRVVNVGVMDYQECFDLQKQLLKLRQEGKIEDTILFVEHPKVITKGIRAEDSNIIVNDRFLEANNVKVYEVRRGGDVTYHGPGQIVGYFIVNIKEAGLGVKEFVTNIEEVMIDTLRNYDVNAGRMDAHTGVWVDDEKITAIGVEVKRWVTMHGFALNVNTNLFDFGMIVPCGIVDKGVTSLEKILEKKVPLETVHEQLIRSIEHVFPFVVTKMEKEALLDEIQSID